MRCSNLCRLYYVRFSRVRPFSLQRYLACVLGLALLSNTSYAIDSISIAKIGGAILSVAIPVYLFFGIIIMGWWFLTKFIAQNKFLRALLRAVPVAIFGAVWFGPSSVTYSSVFASFITYLPMAFVASFLLGDKD